MPGECAFVYTRDSLPQTDGFILTPTSDCSSIWTEGDTSDPTRMPREQGNFGAGVCTIEPNTDPTCDRETATGFFTQVALG